VFTSENSRMEEDMIAELIKLSKELYELEMVDESVCIDDMIQKLYGVAVGDDELKYEDSEDDYEYNPNVTIENAELKKEDIKLGILDLVSEKLDNNDIKELISSLEDYLE